VRGIEDQGFIIVAALHYGHGCANAVSTAWIYSVADRLGQACLMALLFFIMFFAKNED